MKETESVQNTGEGNALRVWVVTAPSGIHMGVCFLGRGATKAEALDDAFGPGWRNSNHASRSAKRADVYQTSAAEADELEHGVY